MTQRADCAVTHAKQNLFILFNFVFFGPMLGWAAIFPFWMLYGTAVSVMKRPVSLLEWVLTPLTFLLGFALGIPFAYWIGFVPALIAGGVVCVVHTAEFRISWPVQAAAAAAALLPEIVRAPTHFAIGNLLTGAIACLVATVACCWLLRRWTEFSGIEP